MEKVRISGTGLKRCHRHSTVAEFVSETVRERQAKSLSGPIDGLSVVCELNRKHARLGIFPNGGVRPDVFP